MEDEETGAANILTNPKSRPQSRGEKHANKVSVSCKAKVVREHHPSL